MIVVPNHIIEQLPPSGSSFTLPPTCLWPPKKDFETKNRKKFCARIATSDIDAVIIGHSQFEKVPLSTERQQRMLEEQIDEIIDGIAEAKAQRREQVHHQADGEIKEIPANQTVKIKRPEPER